MSAEETHDTMLALLGTPGVVSVRLVVDLRHPLVYMYEIVFAGEPGPLEFTADSGEAALILAAAHVTARAPLPPAFERFADEWRERA